MGSRPGLGKSSDPGQVMTVEQVAAYLQLNRLTVYRYIREGKIPAARIGKLYRVLKSDVDRFLEAQKVGASRGGRQRAEKPVRARAPQPAPAAPRAKYSDEAYIGPQWRDRLKEREDEKQARLTGYPLEWVMRGLH